MVIQALTVKELIRRLKDFPQDATVNAYEGEENGINICISEDAYRFINFYPETKE